ncbi:MAG: helix-turn-helix domain-containing protein [Treponema sp.]|jgi:DNA-binding XRE family transcriptional regulator|nr:helix-turn-helix domain-containing protein [Treponema sp.]
MQVQEKTRRINATITGTGVDEIKYLIIKYLPEAIITDNYDEDAEAYVKWEDTDLYKEICARETPGKVLTAYRMREGLSLVELANKTGIKYTNISAMEHDNRIIGLSVAKRLAKVLNCDYTRFLCKT